MKKLWKFLGSMRLAMILLALLILACIAGSFLPQGLSLGEYTELYSERTAGLILGLGLDDVFHARWFLALTVCLCGNLLLCNLIRLRHILRQTKDAADPAKRGAPSVTLEGVTDPDAVFARLRMPKPVETLDSEGRALRFSVKNRVGLWGAWVCHLGVVLLIVGFALGQITMEQYTVYGVPGQRKPIGDTSFDLEIRDFRVLREADGFITQYETDLTVYDLSDENAVSAEEATVGVNHPGDCFGFKLYQNSTGETDTAKLTVRRDGKTIQESLLCAGEEQQMLDTPLRLQLGAVLRDEAEGEPGTPGYAYLIYVGEELYTMNVQAEGELIPDFTPYEVSFSEAQSRSYTLIQLKRDRFAPLAFAGGLVTLLGMLLAFYFQTQKLWALRQEDGSWTVCGQSRKGGVLFADRVRAAIEKGRQDAL